MYCPSCGTEYREGFTGCADCGVRLVRERPPEIPPEYVDLAAVVSGLNSGEVSFVRSVLDNEQIPYIVQGESLAGIYAGAVRPRLLVPRNKLETATALLRDLIVTGVEVASPEAVDTWTCSNCHEQVDGTLGECWSCSAPRPGGPAR